MKSQTQSNATTDATPGLRPGIPIVDIDDPYPYTTSTVLLVYLRIRRPKGDSVIRPLVRTKHQGYMTN